MLKKSSDDGRKARSGQSEMCEEAIAKDSGDAEQDEDGEKDGSLIRQL